MNTYGVAGVLLIVLLGLLYWSYTTDDRLVPPTAHITSFDECKAAGYPIAESYPEQCFTPDGRGFTRVIDDPAMGINACDADAKLCPDGTSVGRVPPSCEFAACSGPSTPRASGIQGRVLLGPVCPVEQTPPDPNCADKPYETTLAATTVDGAREIKTFSTDVRGAYVVNLPPGEYAIRSASLAEVRPVCASNGTITVKAGAFTEAEISCDSGIR